MSDHGKVNNSQLKQDPAIQSNFQTSTMQMKAQNDQNFNIGQNQENSGVKIWPKIIQFLRIIKNGHKKLVYFFKIYKQQIMIVASVLITMFLFREQKYFQVQMVCPQKQITKCRRQFFDKKSQQIFHFFIIILVDSILVIIQFHIIRIFIQRLIKLIRDYQFQKQNMQNVIKQQKSMIQQQKNVAKQQKQQENRKQQNQNTNKQAKQQQLKQIKIQDNDKKYHKQQHTQINYIKKKTIVKIFMYVLLTQLFLILDISQLCTGQAYMDSTNMVGAIKAAHIVFIIVLAIIYAIFFIVSKCIRICKKYKHSCIAISCVLIFILIILFIIHNKNSCQFHTDGINGQILNDKNCKLYVNQCQDIKLSFQFNFNFVLHNCFLGDKYKQVLKDFFPYQNNTIDKNKNIIAFADLKDKTREQKATGILQKTMQKYAKRYSSIQQANKNGVYDVLLDIDNQKYIIDVKRNETLVREKQQLWKKYIQNNLKHNNKQSKPLSKNILLIFIDAVSRFQTHQQLSKTVSWFKKHSKYQSYLNNQNQLKDQINSQNNLGEAYEAYKYHSLGYETNQNAWDMYYGHNYQFLKTEPTEKIIEFNNKQQFPNSTLYHHYIDQYSKRGFITGSTSTYCSITANDQTPFLWLQTLIPSFDHQTISFGCDRNAVNPYFQFSFQNGDYASTDRCLYGKKKCEYAFEHALSFFKAYKDQPKIYQMNMMQGHDFVGSSVGYADQPFQEFLKQFQRLGYAKDTLIITYSDHGHHYGNVFQNAWYFHFLPFLYYYVPEQTNKVYRDALRINQQNLITAHNLYATFHHIARGENYENKNMSLFSDLSFQNSCQNAKITNFCACKS